MRAHTHLTVYIPVGIDRRGRLAGQRIGRAGSPKHRALEGLLHLGDLSVGVVGVGRDETIRQGRRHRASRRVIGVGGDVGLR